MSYDVYNNSSMIKTIQCSVLVLSHLFTVHNVKPVEPNSIKKKLTHYSLRSATPIHVFKNMNG